MIADSSVARAGIALLMVAVVCGLGSYSADVAYAQRVLLFEDFEDSIPDLPADEAVASLGSFTRSEVLENDPGTITVTGGDFPDPFSAGGGFAADFNGDGTVNAADLNDPQGWQARFGAGLVGSDLVTWQCELAGSPCGAGGTNQSMILHNPNAAVQQAANWFNIFPQDANDPNFFLKNGVIEFDLYMEEVPSDGWWTFLGVRLGFELLPEDLGQVSTEGDQNIWNSFRMKEGGLDSAAGNFLFDQQNVDPNTGFGQIYTDDTVIVTDKQLHVRYEIDGVNAVYSVFIDDVENADPEVEVIDDQPWAEIFNFQTFMFEPAPGINEISFITDASSRGIGSMSAGNVYLDNVLVIDNDQAPEGGVAAVPEPNSIALLALLVWTAVGQKRGRRRGL